VIFMRVACLANTALEVHPGALLDDVGGLVRGRVEIRGRRECGVIAGGERLRSHRACPLGSLDIRMCFDASNVMPAEGTLDGARER
jgi:hypothetical protein